MLIEMEVKIVNSGAVHTEEYVIDEGVDPEDYCRVMIDNFNNTLRHGESPRELLGVKVLDEGYEEKEHTWIKQNMFTIVNARGVYDEYRCDMCGITGKRYGVGNPILRDSKYKAKVYSNCTTAIKHLNKRGK